MFEENALFDGEEFKLIKKKTSGGELFQLLDDDNNFLFTSRDVFAYLKDTYSDIITELRQQEEFDSLINDSNIDILQRYTLDAIIKVKQELIQNKYVASKDKDTRMKHNIITKQKKFDLNFSNTEKIILENIYNRKNSNYLEYYTKSILYLLQKYGKMTAEDLASCIGGIKAKQLYDVFNVLMEFNIIKKSDLEYVICLEKQISEPIINIKRLEEELHKVQEEIGILSVKIHEKMSKQHAL